MLRLGASVKRRLERWGWTVRVEVSYSRYGERGRIDLLAWHSVTGFMLVVEIKTELVDVQALLGPMDVKARLATHAASQFGWEVRAVVPAIVFVDDRRTRNRLADLDVLFDRYSLRGRVALSWLRHPSGLPAGVLWFAPIPASVRRPAGQRVYPGRRGADRP